MLPSCEDAVVVVVVTAADVVGYVFSVVVVDGARLVFRVEILDNYFLDNAAFLQRQFASEHDVLKVVEQVAVVLLHVPFGSCPVAVVVEEEQLGVVVEIVVGIDAEIPRRRVVVDSCHPAAEHVALHVLVDGLSHVASSAGEGVPERR